MAEIDSARRRYSQVKTLKVLSKKRANLLIVWNIFVTPLLPKEKNDSSFK